MRESEVQTVNAQLLPSKMMEYPGSCAQPSPLPSNTKWLLDETDWPLVFVALLMLKYCKMAFAAVYSSSLVTGCMSTDIAMAVVWRDRPLPEPDLHCAQLSDRHTVCGEEESAILKEGESELPPNCDPYTAKI